MNEFKLFVGVIFLGCMLPQVGAAKGCLKGAAVGGVAGHVAGHHAVLGAAVGCAVGHERAKAKDRELARAANAQAPSK